VREGFTHVVGSVAVGKWVLAPSIEAARLCRTDKDRAPRVGIVPSYLAHGSRMRRRKAVVENWRLVDGQSDDFKRGGTGI
jgi:hypothetical protein